MQRGFWDDLKKPIIGLSPMDGVTDAAYRYIMDKYGHPSILVTEFTPVEALNRDVVRALEMFIYHKTETPNIAQIYGTELDSYYTSALLVAEMGFDGLDINMGCPDKSDNDEAGKKGAERTAEMLAELNAPQTHIIRLPDTLGKGGDITDYFIKHGGTIEELFSLATLYPEPIDPTRFSPLSSDDLADILNLTIKHDVENKRAAKA
jgi:hypothetical protein